MRRMGTHLLSVTQVAEMLRFEPRTIARWCRMGMFPTAHKVGRVWRIALDDSELHIMVYSRNVRENDGTQSV